MLDFWVCFIAMGLVGLFVVLILQFRYKHWWSRIICVILSFAIAGFLLGGASYLDNKGDDEVWNNGHCEICNEEWRLSGVTGRNIKTYYWSCEDCGNTIVTGVRFK